MGSFVSSRFQVPSSKQLRGKLCKTSESAVSLRHVYCTPTINTVLVMEPMVPGCCASKGAVDGLLSGIRQEDPHCSPVKSSLSH